MGSFWTSPMGSYDLYLHRQGPDAQLYHNYNRKLNFILISIL